MGYGVLTCQRGWAAMTDVANALSREEFLTWARHRRGSSPS